MFSNQKYAQNYDCARTVLTDIALVPLLLTLNKFHTVAVVKQNSNFLKNDL